MNQIAPFAAAWRTMQVGTREVADVILHPLFHGGTPELEAALAQWPGKWYWQDDARSRLVLVRPLAEIRPNWLWHGSLMALTVLLQSAGASPGPGEKRSCELKLKREDGATFHARLESVWLERVDWPEPAVAGGEHPIRRGWEDGGR